MYFSKPPPEIKFEEEVGDGRERGGPRKAEKERLRFACGRWRRAGSEKTVRRRIYSSLKRVAIF